VFFFFSSRRRHTRCYRDWSSDMCSSDLEPQCLVVPAVDHEVEPIPDGRQQETHVGSASVCAGSPVADGLVVDAAMSGDNEAANKIGRASCRERVRIWEVQRAWKKTEHAE